MFQGRGVLEGRNAIPTTEMYYKRQSWLENSDALRV